MGFFIHLYTSLALRRSADVAAAIRQAPMSRGALLGLEPLRQGLGKIRTFPHPPREPFDFYYAQARTQVALRRILEGRAGVIRPKVDQATFQELYQERLAEVGRGTRRPFSIASLGTDYQESLAAMAQFLEEMGERQLLLLSGVIRHIPTLDIEDDYLRRILRSAQLVLEKSGVDVSIPSDTRDQMIVAWIRARLDENRDADHAEGAKRYFGEDFKCYGVKAAKPKIRRFITEALRKAREGGTKVDFKLRIEVAEELFKSGMYEEGQAAILLLQNQGTYFTPETLSLFGRWLDHYIDNWGICDSFCIGVVYQIIEKYPKEVDHLLEEWALSENPWVRRAACATLSKLARDGSFATEVARLIDILLENGEEEDIVHKAMGWALKELSRAKPQFVVDYLNSRSGRIPTVTLHHSLERIRKLPRLYGQIDRSSVRKSPGS